MLASPLSGYIAQFHARMDEQENDLRHRTKTLDFAWAPSRSLGLAALTLGSLGNTGYSTPEYVYARAPPSAPDRAKKKRATNMHP
jgi:hypothetical protein